MELPLDQSEQSLERALAKPVDDEEPAITPSPQITPNSNKKEVDAVAKWIEKKTQFIHLERIEDAMQTEQALAILPLKELESKGIALKNLMVDETRTGLWGRMIMTLSKAVRSSKNDSDELPSHRFSPGDIVCIKINEKEKSSTGKPDNSVRGIVFKVSSTKIQVALSEKPIALKSQPNGPVTSKKQENVENDLMYIDFSKRMVSMILVGNDTTFKRMEKAIGCLEKLKAHNSISSSLNILFGIETPSPINYLQYFPLNTRYTSASMNESQCKAIAGALSSKQLFLIHGPPGTGKTTVLIEYILQEVKQAGKRLLVCAPSNVAVDNIVERLALYAKSDPKFKMVRIGHPARVQASALNYSVEEQYRQSNGYEVFQALTEDMDRLAKQIPKASYADRKQLKRDWLSMKHDLKRVSMDSMKQVVQQANVVLSTCTGADDKLMKGSLFDAVVIDEAAQALDPIILIPLLKSNKVILAGDHLQLPPTIKSTTAVEKSLCNTTFFERAIRRFPSVSCLLSVQYRMNDIIMMYSSQYLYHGKLISDNTVKEHRLQDLIDKRHLLLQSSSSSPNEPKALPMKLQDYLDHPLILVDTAGCSFEESGGPNESKSNEGEASVVTAIVQQLIQAGLSPSDIGIISPYNAHVDLLRNKLRLTVGGELEISSVDSFQGREKECIIYTLVRSNPNRNIGFLSSDQRTNVAITRAKRLLIIVADTETVGSHKFLKRLFSFCESKAQYWSAAEFETAYEKVDTKQYGKKQTPKTQTVTSDCGVSKSSSSTTTVQMPAPPEITPDILNPSIYGAETLSVDSQNITTDHDQSHDLASEIASKQETDAPPSASVPASAAQNQLAAPNIRLVDYRAQQKALFEAHKSGTSKAPNVSAGLQLNQQSYFQNSKEFNFGIQTEYAPHAPSRKPSRTGNPSPSSSSSNGSSSTSKDAPVAVKSHLLKLDDNEFLDSIIKENEHCYSNGCKQSLHLFSQMCRFCKHNYCLKHMGAEQHGCGEEAKREGKTAAQKNAAEMRSRASSRPVINSDGPKLKDWQKSSLQGKLNQKIESQKDQRTKKKSAKK